MLLGYSDRLYLLHYMTKDKKITEPRAGEMFCNGKSILKHFCFFSLFKYMCVRALCMIMNVSMCAHESQGW